MTTQLVDMQRVHGWIDAYIMSPHMPHYADGFRQVASSPDSTKEEAAEAQAALESIRDKRRVAPAIGFIYVLQGGGYCKIGRSIHPGKRVVQISPALPFSTNLTHIMVAYNASRAEAYFQRLFAELHTNGEWFALSAADIAMLESSYGFRRVTPETLDSQVRFLRSLWEEAGNERPAEGPIL